MSCLIISYLFLVITYFLPATNLHITCKLPRVLSRVSDPDPAPDTNIKKEILLITQKNDC